MTPATYVDWLGRGRAHQSEQRPVDAMLCYRRAVRLFPAGHEAHQHLGEVLWQMGKLHEALAEWREARRAAPGDLAAHIAYAEGNLAIGRFDEAHAAAADALARFPGLAPALLISAIAGLALDPALDAAGAEALGADIASALTSDYALLRMPSLAGPLAASLDRLSHDAARAQAIAPVAAVLERVDLVAQLPALLVALVAEHLAATGAAASVQQRLLDTAVGRPYGAAEHDAVRRIGLAAWRMGHERAQALADRYAALCAEIFGPSVPLVWPARTRGERLRVLVLVRGDDALAAPDGWMARFARANEGRCEITALVQPAGDGAARFDEAAWPDAVRPVVLPDGIAAADPRQIALLDGDVLVDAVGMIAATGPVMAARPARSLLALHNQAPTLSVPLVDATIPSTGALERELAARALHRDVAIPPEPAAMTAMFNDAVTLHREGQRAAALDAYTRVLELQPAHAQTLYLRGSLREETGDAEGALRDLRDALAAAPRFIDARVAAVRVATALGLADAAVALAQEHLAMAPGFLPLWRGLGLALLAQHDGKTAAEAFAYALHLDVTDGETHYNHGVALADAATATGCGPRLPARARVQA